MKTQNEIGDSSSIEIKELEFLAASLRLQAETIPPFPSKCCIYKIPYPLRAMNEASYSPKVVSIGPIHHGKKDLRYMEENKLRLLQNVLDKSETFNLKNCVSYLKEIEERCRQCYSETIDMESDQFVRMMLLDSIFISEFFFQVFKDEIRCENGPLNNMNFWRIPIRLDMLLLENQLPFFVVKYIFNLILGFGQEDNTFQRSVLIYFNAMPEISGNTNSNLQNNEPDHLLDLLRRFLISSSQMVYPLQPGEKSEILECATKLDEAGVTFKVNKGKTSLDITFENGVLEMPLLYIGENTESIFRNLIALEQCHGHTHYVSDFAFLMVTLINSHEDVALLSHKRIIKNWLGNNEEVALLFNKLCQNIAINSRRHCYQNVFQGLVAHSNKSWNKHKANFKRDYLSTPWKTISLVAAFILVILTFMQTVTSFLSLKR